ncbi:MAG: hypothetical protein FWF59_07465 [Turicibacter sp.]|nr:hypothetical protein [Turicibacter sp.]
MNEPFYKKWWAWIGLLTVSATIIHHGEISEDDGYNQLLSVFEEDKVIPLCCDSSSNYEEMSGLSDNFLLVGADIPAGDYFIKADENTHGYVMLAKDNSGSLDAVITNKNFRTHSFLTVKEGEYLIVKRATLFEAGQAVVPTFMDGTLGDGVYRVGIDIPAGTYLVKATSNVAGYYQVATDSRGTSSNIVSNSNFTEEISITLDEGQYLTLTRAQIIK